MRGPSTGRLGGRVGKCSWLGKQGSLLALGSTEHGRFSPARVAAAPPALGKQIRSLSQQRQNCVPRSVVVGTVGAGGGEEGMGGSLSLSLSSLLRLQLLLG